jgi:hypothetical protein
VRSADAQDSIDRFRTVAGHEDDEGDPVAEIVFMHTMKT